MILFSAEAILASSTSKIGIEIPRVDDEDLNSSTESTNSTSLIHCIASAGNCEGDGDVVGVVTPLVRGGAQVLHGDQVVELSVLLEVHEKEERMVKDRSK